MSETRAFADAGCFISYGADALNAARLAGIYVKSSKGPSPPRAKDGADEPESYRPRTTAGVYVPTAIPVFSHFPTVTPFLMTSGTQFRPAAPPALDSLVWTTDVNEIRLLGARNSTVRTAESL
jgi:hypothetical protein